MAGEQVFICEQLKPHLFHSGSITSLKPPYKVDFTVVALVTKNVIMSFGGDCLFYPQVFKHLKDSFSHAF